MKTKLFLLAFMALFLSSCESIFAEYEMELIGSGQFMVSVLNDNGSSTNNYTSGRYKIGSNENWYVTAQSLNGSGVKVRVYIGSELVKQGSASGYGVVSIHN